MFRLLSTMSTNKVAELVGYLEEGKDNLEDDVSNYAKGRQRYWLQYEWSLRDRNFSTSYKDARIWSMCKTFMPDADLGLVVYGSIGIGLHRDDTYADWRGVGINLGDIDAWLYDCQYPGFKWTSRTNTPDPKEHDIPIGGVFEFNTKNPHGVKNPADDRWAIFLWKVNSKLRRSFELVNK